MKKSAIIAIFCAAALMTGCIVKVPVTSSSSGSSQKSEVSKASSDTSVSSDTTAESVKLKPGESTSIGGFSLSVDSFEFSERIKESEYIGFKPDEGDIYLIVALTVKNTSTEAKTFAQSYSIGKNGAKVIYDNNYEFTGTNLLGYSRDIHDSHLNPLSSISGDYIFNVAKEVENSDLPIDFIIEIGDETVTYSLR